MWLRIITATTSNIQLSHTSNTLTPLFPSPPLHLGLLVRDHVQLLLADSGLGLVGVVEVLLRLVGGVEPLSPLAHLVLQPRPHLRQLLGLLPDWLRLRAALGRRRRHAPTALLHLVHPRLVALDLLLQSLEETRYAEGWSNPFVFVLNEALSCLDKMHHKEQLGHVWYVLV